MPIFDLNSPTELLVHWGWVLVTRANGFVFVLLVVAFLLGALVSLPGERSGPASPRAAGGSGDGSSPTERSET